MPTVDELSRALLNLMPYALSRIEDMSETPDAYYLHARKQWDAAVALVGENCPADPLPDLEAEPVTAVVFRVWRDGNVLALFPYQEWSGNDCASYEHVGQHGGADYRACIEQTRPAKPEEFATLKSELENIGYRLRVIKRRGVRS